MNIKPIETIYKGYRFRSRLEARWAVFFDAMGIEWEYEKEGFDLGDAGWYLPDFWLPQVEMWAEVKPGPLKYDEIRRCKALNEATGQGVILLEGTPDVRSYYVCGSDHSEEGCDRLMSPNGDVAAETDGGYPGGDYDLLVNLCDVILNCDYFDENRFYWCAGHGDWPEPNRLVNHYVQDIEKAVVAARSARFEHGEKP
jgi:hypothetical protein